MPASGEAESVPVEVRVLNGRYRLERQLGEGASGRVYLARDTRERGAVWAVKELSCAGLPSKEREEVRSSFFREYELLSQLRHPQLPRVEDAFSEKGALYLVMERVEGPTLLEVLRAGPLCEPETMRLGAELAGVLDYLHSRTPPVLYRDLKPANVMLESGRPSRLIDFGIARLRRPHQKGDTTAYGTPGYAPPEQYSGQTQPRSDIFALGVTLHRALTGREPSELGFKVPLAGEFAPEVYPPFEAFLASMTAWSPEDRPTAEEVRVALELWWQQQRDRPMMVRWMEGRLRRLRRRLS